jgi:hypothetical protein
MLDGAAPVVGRDQLVKSLTVIRGRPLRFGIDHERHLVDGEPLDAEPRNRRAQGKCAARRPAPQRSRAALGLDQGLNVLDERRDVDLTADLVELLGGWWGELGRPDDQALVFPGETPGGHLSPTTVLRRELYPAMKRAGVPRVGPTGEKRTFHSFRHSYAKVALENGRRITWLSRHLGHSSLKVTTDIHGHFERAERKAEAVFAGVFAGPPDVRATIRPGGWGLPERASLAHCATASGAVAF